MSTQDITAVSVLSRNLLPQAATLAQSLASTNPTIRLKAYLLDDFPEEFEHSANVQKALDTSTANLEILPLSALQVPSYDRLKFQYTPLELACALKPFAIRHALNNFSAKVIYCDSDLCFYESLDVTEENLDRCSILLTPHLSIWKREDGDGASAKFLNINQGGVFNAGFIAVRKTESTKQFLDWWQQRCEKHCYIDLTCGIFVDQKWLDFVPSLFDGVHIDRQASMNVGHWNLIDRKLRPAHNGNWVVGSRGEALTFFHFSGFDPEKPRSLTKHDALIDFDTAPFHSLLEEYAERLNEFEPSKYRALGYEFAKLPDGTAIKPEWREAIRSELLPWSQAVWDPTRTGVTRELLEGVEQQALDQRLLWRVEKLQKSADLTPRKRVTTIEKLRREAGRLARQFRRSSCYGKP